MSRRVNYRGGRGGWKSNDQRYKGNQQYVDHDDVSERKMGNSRERRRVSFKPSGAGPPGGRQVFKGYSELAIRSRLEDDDEMIDFPLHGRVDGNFQQRRGGNAIRARRRGSPIPRGGHGPPGQKKLIAGTSGWFQVTIPHGQKYDKTTILKQLHTLVQPKAFIPHYFKTEASAITFFVDDIHVAETLLNADRQLEMPEGFKMLIRVRNSIPHVQIDENLKTKMKLAMVKRYTPATKALNLTKFHSDDDLRDIFCALFRPTIMLAAIDIIAENIPDLEALNLDDNKIHLLDHLKCMAAKLPFLKILHLANNKITSTSALDSLKDCQLVDLVLQGNPLKDRHRDETVYVSEIRKKFPKLLKLDNIVLPPQIGFDVTDDSKLPPARSSFLCNAAGTDVVRQFLEQYFILYDSASRQPLLDAYHEQAMFSMTATYSQQPSIRLTSYLVHSRNNNRIRDLDSRMRLLKNGRLPVVSFLSELPETEHDPQSFAVDLTLFTPQLIQFTVTGLFREKGKRGSDGLRSFQKALVIVPSGTGFCIKNEMLHITNVTIHQVRTAFKPPAVVVAQQVVTAASAVPGVSVGPDDATKMQMINAMSEHSKMNLNWSKKCLEETNWDFDRAGYVFTELHKQSKIPPEAFVM